MLLVTMVRKMMGLTSATKPAPQTAGVSVKTVVPKGYTSEQWADEQKRLRSRSISEDDYLDARLEWLVRGCEQSGSYQKQAS